MGNAATFIIRGLTLDSARAHQQAIESLTSIIGGACSHAPGELIDGEKYISRRYEMSLAAWDGPTLIGVLLASEREAALANADIAGNDYRFPRRSFYMDHLAVAPERQGQGIGRRLLQRWIDETRALAVADGLRRIDWSLETAGTSETAYVRRFYEDHGFFIAGTRRYGPFDDVVMWRWESLERNVLPEDRITGESVGDGYGLT